MKDRLLLIAWLLSVVSVTFIHDPARLGGLLVLAAALVLGGRETARLAGRALAVVALVNLAVSLSYVLASTLAGEPWGIFVLRLNLRVLLLAFLTLWMTRHLDLPRALAFSPSLKFISVLALGQIQLFKRMLLDYRMAFTSRHPAPPPIRHRLGGAGRQATALLEKAEIQACELNHGMRSRGFFDDRA
ncbi:MAG: hypothetical protein RQ741_00545 [Wenzhouxiangellaceae bacterium]|nr:hypothetical protein [Wenzhouxiangellaceae bacterium]